MGKFRTSFFQNGLAKIPLVVVLGLIAVGLPLTIGLLGEQQEMRKGAMALIPCYTCVGEYCQKTGPDYCDMKINECESNEDCVEPIVTATVFPTSEPEPSPFGTPACCKYDLNGDGVVDERDVRIVEGCVGTNCSSPQPTVEQECETARDCPVPNLVGWSECNYVECIKYSCVYMQKKDGTLCKPPEYTVGTCQGGVCVPTFPSPTKYQEPTTTPTWTPPTPQPITLTPTPQIYDCQGECYSKSCSSLGLRYESGNCPPNMPYCCGEKIVLTPTELPTNTPWPTRTPTPTRTPFWWFWWR